MLENDARGEGTWNENRERWSKRSPWKGAEKLLLERREEKRNDKAGGGFPGARFKDLTMLPGLTMVSNLVIPIKFIMSLG